MKIIREKVRETHKLFSSQNDPTNHDGKICRFCSEIVPRNLQKRGNLIKESVKLSAHKRVVTLTIDMLVTKFQFLDIKSRSY